MRKFFILFKLIFVYIPYSILSIFLHCFSKFIPKKKNLILFGAWDGLKFRGNCKLLFRSMLKKNREFECIWITKNIELCKKLNKNNIPCLYWLSLKGIVKTLRAKVFFVSHSHQDVNYFLSGGALVINLMHYNYSIKKMGKKIHADTFLLKSYIFLRYPLHYLIDRVDYYFCVSEFQASIVKKIYNISKRKNKIKINYGIKKDFLTSNNKSEFFFDFEVNNSVKLNSNKKNIFFLPTHRKRHTYKFFEYKFNANKLNMFLGKNNANLYINFHPHTIFSNVPDFKKYENIIFLKNIGDENSLILNNIDLLITDYSAIYSDFLLFDKPILLAPFDYKEFIENDRDLINEYFDLPNHFAYNWDEIIMKIEEIFSSKSDKFYNDRILLKKNIYPNINKSGIEETLKLLKILIN